MRRFIKTIIIFTIPFLILAVILIYIDPYNIIREEKNDKLIELKSQISFKVDYPLYKLQEYYNNPKDIIVLGDSRAIRLKHHLINDLTQKEVMNLAYGGGTLPEIIDTFWFSSKLHKLKQVYIGLNFNLYNALNNRNGVTEANNTRKSISSYLSSRSCIKSTYLILLSIITNKKIDIEKPPFSKDDFWTHQLNWAGPRFYQDYKYPEQYYFELIKISKYCKQNKIKLVFFMSPTHTELQQKINQYNRENEYQKFVEDLKCLETTIYDFDFPSEITKNKQNFGDPFHFNDSISVIVTKIILGDSLYSEKYKNDFNILAFKE